MKCGPLSNAPLLSLPCSLPPRFANSPKWLHATKQEAQAEVDGLAGELEDELEDAVFSSAGESLEEIVGYALQMRNAKLAVAELRTGGMIAERITSVPWKFALLSGRSGGVFERSEDAVCRCPSADDRSARRSKQRSGAGAGGKHPRDSQCRHRRRSHGRRRSRRRYGREAGWLVYVAVTNGHNRK